MIALLGRLHAMWEAMTGPAPMRPARVGVLNTGELVLIDGLGRAEVVSCATTGLIREALIDTDPDLSEMVIGLHTVPGGH